MRRIAIVNQKGGCGKTTTSINLAGLFAKRGLRTLLVDMDPQSHCAAGLAIPEARIDQDIGDAMLAPDPEKIDPARLLWRVSRNLDLAPSRMKVAGLEASRGGLADKPDKEFRLARVLRGLEKSYDICCIDCSPSVGLLTFNALAAATEVLIPVETSYFSLQGASKQVNTIRSLEKRLGVTAPCWLLATIHDETSALARDLLEELKRRYGSRVLPTVIRLDPTLKEAASFGQPVAEYSPTSHGAADYGALADWLVSRGVPAPPAAHPASEPQSDASASAPADRPPAAESPPDQPEIHIVTGTGVEASLGRCMALAESSPIPQAAQSRPDRDAVLLAEAPSANPVALMSPDPERPPVPLTRAEDMLNRARRLISRGDQLTRRRFEPEAVNPEAITPEAVNPEAVNPEAVNPEAVNPEVNASSPPAPPVSAFTAPPALPASSRPIASLSGALPRSGPALGCTPTPGGALFVQPLSIGQQVCVAGDFNNWSPMSHRLQPNPSLGVHELCIPLPPGRRLYRLVVDGRWTADPFNPVIETNPFGEPNSIAIVGRGWPESSSIS